MKSVVKYLIGTAVVVVICSGAYFLFSQRYEKRALAELVRKTRDNMIFIEGGNFYTGNYQSRFRLPDGRVEEGWVGDYYPGAPSEDITLDSFYLSAFETSYADFNLYLSAQGYPTLEENREYHLDLSDRAASMSFEEATKYCAWLAQQVGLTMRLPTEAEWEYAARSRGLTPFWGTNDGSFHPGVNVAALGRDLTPDKTDPPIGTFPPNPLGLYNLADGLYEWVSDRRENDPEGAAIFKGGSNFSDSFYERIPSRGIVERKTQQVLDFLKTALRGVEYERLLRQDDPLSPGSLYTTARCALSDTRPPATSGFGQMPGPITLTPPYSGQE